MEKVKLSDIFELQMGKTPARNKGEYWGGDNQWVSIADLSNSGKYIEKTKEYITDKAIEESGIKNVPENTIIMSFKLSIGKTAITKKKIYTNEAIMAFIDKKVYPLDIDYLYHFFSGVDWSEGSNKAVLGLTLNKATLAQKYISIPSLEEQRAIAGKLDKVSELIEKRKAQLEKLDLIIKSRFIEMFGDKGYPEDTLLNLCNIIDYRGKTPEKVENGLPFITAKNVKMHQMNLEPREYISKETYDKVMVRGFPKEGDVVFTTEAPLGNVCRIPHFDTEFYIGQRIVTMQTEKLEPIYLEYALSSDDFKTKYMEKSSGSTVTGIRVRLLEQLTIPIPPIEEQYRFATFVEQIDKSKFEIQKSLEKLETLKKSLMQKYFG